MKLDPSAPNEYSEPVDFDSRTQLLSLKSQSSGWTKASRMLFGLLLAGLIVSAFALPALGAASDVSGKPVSGIPSTGTVYNVGTIPSTAEIVSYGITPVNVYGVSVAGNTWDFNFYMWMRWKGDLDPTSTTQFINTASAETSFQVTYAYTASDGSEQPMTLPDGSKFQRLYVQGGFAQDFKLNRYPLDSQKLQIRFSNSTYPLARLAYVADPNQKINNNFSISSWKTVGITNHNYVEQLSSVQGIPPSNWSMGTWTIEIRRPFNYFLYKLLIPMAIVLIASVVALLLSPELEGSRLSLAAGGLLTLIFLQQGYAGDLPPNSGLTMIDKYYALGYIVVIATFLRIIWETSQVFIHKKEELSFVKADRRLAVIISAAFVAGCVIFTIVS